MVQPASSSGAFSPNPSSPTQAAKRRSKPSWWLIPLTVGILAVGGGLWWRLGQSPDKNVVALSGRLEGYPTNVDVKVAGRIEELMVREGDRVEAGQVVARLDEAELQAQQAGAQARLQSARDREQQARLQLNVITSQIREATLVQAQAEGDSAGGLAQAQANLATAQAQLAQAQAQQQEAQAQLRLAQSDRDRLASLFQAGGVSAQEYDQAVTRYDTAQELVRSRAAAVEAAQRQVTAATGAVTQAQSRTLNPAIRSTQVETLQQQLNVAQAQLAQAQADVANASAAWQETEARLNNLTVVSPIAGIVLTRSAEPGTVVSPGSTLLTVLDPNQVFLRGFIPQGQIGLVRVGQTARVFLDSAPDQPLEATVRAIDPQASFTPENIYFREDRVRQVFGVELAITDPGGY
ncbi:MAG TPA: HlyD family efflux transporter periplasmic adaptor subunit, partial [Leptolyngbyaceae cyanobacterium M65_K2018_010]|nr:HlyD family efflux transporter periplasmic adaptor subunit [Leptolyngbyaceae cyanobacterium M65_K2018_010]